MKLIFLPAIIGVLALSIGCAQDPNADTNRGHTYAVRTQTGLPLQIPANTGTVGAVPGRGRLP